MILVFWIYAVVQLWRFWILILIIGLLAWATATIWPNLDDATMRNVIMGIAILVYLPYFLIVETNIFPDRTTRAINKIQQDARFRQPPMGASAKAKARHNLDEANRMEHVFESLESVLVQIESRSENLGGDQRRQAEEFCQKSRQTMAEERVQLAEIRAYARNELVSLSQGPNLTYEI